MSARSSPISFIAPSRINPKSFRRAGQIAAALAGYAAINCAALLAAVEFGIQPIFFTDASGAPLYAPFPLHIAIPAMMIGHLTFAGLAELIVTGGVVAYLQKSDPSLLKLTAPDAPGEIKTKASGWSSTKSLWIGLAALMILTPLGLLAAGTAWGEWSAEDFNDPAARKEISAVSNDHAAPEIAPQGLEKLSKIWTAPVPDYAPAFLSSEKFGYIMSAIFGTGIIIALFLIVGWIAGKISRRHSEKIIAPGD